MIHVIWATPTPMNEDWESDWIHELFENVENVEWHTDNHLTLSPMKNAVIVYNIKDSDRLQKIVNYLHAYEDARIPYGLIHLSDEFYNTYYAMYQYPHCKFVYRNYWHKDLTLPNVRFFALGYKRGFCMKTGDTHRDGPSFTWCFAGNMKTRHPERQNGLERFKERVPNGYIVLEEGDRFSNRVTGLDTSKYRQMLENSIFAFCPPGNVNIDSFRICEAMECGTIPVVLSKTIGQDTYWTSLFETNTLPFVCEPTWDACIDKMNQLLADDSWKLVSKQVNEFWAAYKNRMKDKMLIDVKENFGM